MNHSLYQLCWIFVVYSFIGWCAGVIVNAVQKRKFINTGFMSLTFCPAYGLGAVLYSIFLTELRVNWLFLFVAGAVVGAVQCILTGVVLQRIFHRRWWDYSKKRFQFDGYLHIGHLIAFGASALFIFWVGNPLIFLVLSWMPKFIGHIFLLGILGIMLIDCIVSSVAVLQLKIRLRPMEQFTENMQKVTNELGDALTVRIQRRMLRAYPNLESEKSREPERTKQNSVVFAKGCCFYKLVWLFLIGAFLGDIVETIFCYLTDGVWMSRSSVVYGPFSFVWGIACALLTGLLYKYKDKNDRYMFFAGTVLGGTYEYMCSVFTEIVFGTVFWDYSDIPFNLGGRINLLYCFFWGIAAVVWFKGIYPKLSALIEKIPQRTGIVITWLCIGFMLINAALSGMALSRYDERQREDIVQQTEEPDSLSRFLDKHFPDERMERIYPNAKTVNEER